MKNALLMVALLMAMIMPSHVEPAKAASRTAFSAVQAAAASGPAGRWQVTEVANGPWAFEFTAEGTALSGTVRQNGPQNSPVSIAAGKIEGTTISFKVLSPDAERIITFRGRVNGNEISFLRQISVLSGGHRGGNDLYGASAALQFVAKRPPAGR